MIPMGLATELLVLEILFRNQNKIFLLDTLPKDQNCDTPSTPNGGPLAHLCLNI